MDRRAAAAILLMLSLVVGAAVADDVDTIRLPGDSVTEGTAPWKCCDDLLCSAGGMCACKDVVKECACNKCKTVPGGFMCRDAAWIPEEARPPTCN